MFKTELVTVVTYHQTTAAVWIDVILQEGAPETCCVAPSGADVDSIDAEQRCVCVWGGETRRWDSVLFRPQTPKRTEASEEFQTGE